MRSESARPRVLLDTKPLIKLFAKEEGWEAVQKIASRIEADEIDAGLTLSASEVGRFSSHSRRLYGSHSARVLGTANRPPVSWTSSP